MLNKTIIALFKNQLNFIVNFDDFSFFINIYKYIYGVELLLIKHKKKIIPPFIKILKKKRVSKFIKYTFNNNVYKKTLNLASNIKKLKAVVKSKLIINRRLSPSQLNNKTKNIKTIQIKYYSIFSSLFSKLFKKNIQIINYNYYLKVKVLKLSSFVKKIQKKFSFFKKTPFLYKIIKMLLASLIFKDSKLLTNIIREVFEFVHYSKHRMYFIFWRTIIKNIFFKYYKKLGVLGVLLEFHGKLAVGGNSKKRSYYYSFGRYSNSTKDLKVDSSNNFYRTETGVSGFTYSIFY